jgi:hypothetical protein
MERRGIPSRRHTGAPNLMGAEARSETDEASAEDQCMDEARAVLHPILWKSRLYSGKKGSFGLPLMAAGVEEPWWTTNDRFDEDVVFEKLQLHEP